MHLIKAFTISTLSLLFPLLAHATGQTVIYSYQQQTYEGHYVDSGPNAPFVLLIHDWDGLTDYEVKRADMLAALGYSVFALDLFGQGIRPTKNEDKKQHTGELYKDREKMRGIMQAAIEKATALGANTNKAVAMGYCFGGAAVLELARSGANFKGFASFHGGLTTPQGQDYSLTKGQILVLHGAADTAITMDQFVSLNQELETAKIPNEMITYSGAPHAFTVFGSPAYREDADKKSWARFTNFLAEVNQ
jgi:dienelactone hydrolase